MNANSCTNILLRTLCLTFCTAILLNASSLYAQSADIAGTPKTVQSKAQNPVYEMKEVSGQILDAGSKAPIAGVSVSALNNRYYTAMTDENGNYTIKVPVFVTALYVSAPDYHSTQISIKGDTKQDAVLYSGMVRPLYTEGTQLHDVRTMTVDNTSALTIENDIENVLASSVRVINRGGMPAQGAALFMNGLNSLNVNAQPLVVIDGVVQDMQYDRTTIHEGFVNNVFSIVDPEDIENVEVLKNGTALYGARGANGVIRITTRRSRSMVTSIKIRAFGGFETTPDRLKVMDAGQYRNYVTEFLGTTRNAEYLSSTASAPFMNENKNGYLFYDLYHNETDWQRDLYHTAFTQNYKVGVEGGDDVAMYNLSLGYTQSNATAKKNDFSRLNIRFNTDVVMFRNLTTAMDIAYARNAYNILDNGWASDYSRQNIASPNVLGLIQAPFIDPYAYYVSYRDSQLFLGHMENVYAGKNYFEANNPFAFATNFGYEGLVHPYWILKNGHGNNKNYQEQTQFNLNIAPRYQINRYLSVQDRFSYILNRSNERLYLPHDGTPAKEVEGLGAIQSMNRSQFAKETTLFNDLSVNWKRHYAGHFINLLGGFRFVSYSYSDSRLEGYNNDNDKMPNITYNNSQFKDYGGTHDNWINLAYYLDAAYNYQNKYFVNFTTAMESSSRFGKEAKEGIKLAGVKWGIFPSIQAGWLMSSEDWFKVSFIDYLKLTAGYEEVGNDNVDYYATRTYFENLKFLDKATSLVIANIENPKIQWETTRRFNLGLNLHMLKNRLSLGLNYFHSKTSNLLTRKSVSDIAGVGFMWGNDGALKNHGVEFNTNAVLLATKHWKWQAGFSVGHYKNKISALPTSDLNYITTYALNPDGTRNESSESIIHGHLNSIYGVNNVLTAVGRPVGVFYGYETAGIFASDQDARTAGNPAVTGQEYLLYPTGLSAQPYRYFRAGDVHFVDQNGDGWINEADRVEIGDPNPNVYGNIYTNLSWKNLSMDIIFKYSLGNDVYNYQRAQLESLNNIWNQTIAAVNRWRYDGQQTDMPRAMSADNDQWVNNERFSDRWIEDGSYLKLKKVRLTYQFPLSLSWLKGLSVWGEANNVFTLTKYLGTDPEASCGSSVLYQGIDAGWLSPGRTFNFGLTINL